MADFIVQNVVGTITYDQEIDLAALAGTFEKREEVTSVTYEPAENHWLQTRFAPDDTYVAFYRSGRASVAGCKSIDHFEKIVNQVNHVMVDLLETDDEPNYEVSNIVTTTDFGTSLSLEALTLELGMEKTEYEPEQFPALMYRDSGYVMLIFSSGKILCTGLTNLRDISESIEDITSRIQAVM